MNPAPAPFPPQADETLDRLLIQDMTLLQSRSGYRFSIDSVLLSMWMNVKQVHKAADLGTGSGVMPLLASTRSSLMQTDALELQDSLCQRARKNIANNHKEHAVRIIQGDITQIQEILPGNSYDLVFSNPPFFRAGEGIINPHPEKAAARHELYVTLEQVVQASKYLLRPGKSMALVLNAARLAEITGLCLQAGFSLKRLRLVYPRIQAGASMILLEASSQLPCALVIEPPLVIYQEDGNYSPEILSWYNLA